jgi:polyketide biosynthesis enoyl-CoA hydratase PksI
MTSQPQEREIRNGPVRLSRDRGVAIVAMEDGPTHNALGEIMVEGLERAFAAIGAASDINAVVLRGLPEVFCSGASRSLLDALLAGDVNVSELGLPRLLLCCPVPVVAAMRGNAVGGGFALGLAADVMILSERARYGLNFMDLGLTPGMGATWLARERLGDFVGDELLYSTEYRRGRDLRSAPGVNHVVSSDRVEPLALDIARRIAEKPRNALTLLKKNQTEPRLRAFDEARENEMRMHRDRLASQETARLIARNFLG